MRIAIDIRPLLEKQRSGVGTYTHRLLWELTKRSSCPDGREAKEYALFCNSGTGSFPEDIPPASDRIEHCFSKYPNRLLNASFALLDRPQTEDLVGGADAVYMPNLNFAATKKPFAVTVHDLSFIRYPHLFTAKQRIWHSLVRPMRLVRRASAVIAVSVHTKRDIVESFGIPEERIHIVHPGVAENFRPVPERETVEVRKKYGLDRPYLLYLGALEPRKNIPTIISAFERLPDGIDLVLAGGSGWMNRPVLKRMADSPAAPRIKRIGYVNENDKPALYSAATAFVYPSFYEGFGMPPLEAMACGTPVITSFSSSLGEVVGDAGLLVDPHSMRELAEAMQEIVSDGLLRERLGERGVERAKHFTWERSAAQLEEVLGSLK